MSITQLPQVNLGALKGKVEDGGEITYYRRGWMSYH